MLSIRVKPMKVFWTLLLLTAIFGNCVDLVAMIIVEPEVQVIGSPKCNALLRIDPSSRWSRENKKPPAQGTVFVYDEKTHGYAFSATFNLRNPWAPWAAVISDDAQFIATFDDHGDGFGCTENAVVVYRRSGEVVHAWSLEDILSAEEIKLLGPQAMNSSARHWRGSSIKFMDGASNIVWIPGPPNQQWLIAIKLNLTTLTFEKLIEPLGKPGHSK